MMTVQYFMAFLAISALYMQDTAMAQSCEMFSKGNPEKREFYSPLYPNNYGNDMNCELQLTAPRGFVIRVAFHEFSLEPCSGCTCDHVQIHEGNSSQHSRIGEMHCGSDRPPVVTSQGQQLYFKFKSDYNKPYPGFRASYQFLDKIVTVPGLERARERGIAWLRQKTTASRPHLVATARDATPRAAVAMRLAAAADFSGSVAEEELLAQRSQLQTAAALLKPPVPSNQLSLFVNALLATCHNPRRFFGHDLVDRLRAQTLSTPGTAHPSVYIALCNAGQPWPQKALTDLQKVMNSTSKYPFLPDVQAMAVIAVSCMANKGESFNDTIGQQLLVDYQDTLEGFKELRHGDGSFGNVYTTALIVQAMIASGKHHDSSWNLTHTAQFLMRENSKPSVDLLTTYLTLPIFSGRSLADISKMNCSRYTNSTEDDIVPLVEGFLGPKMRVQYSLYVGDQRDVIHTISLRVPPNFTAHQVMRYAAVEDPKYRFQWRQVGARMYVYEIAGIPNDPEMGHFWLTYLSASKKPMAHTTISPEKLMMKDVDHLVLWFKAAELEE